MQARNRLGLVGLLGLLVVLSQPQGCGDSEGSELGSGGDVADEGSPDGAGSEGAGESDAASGSDGAESDDTAVGAGGLIVDPSDPSDTVCEVLNLSAQPQQPEVLILLDRSGSMTYEGRWDPSKAALSQVAMDLDQQLKLGLMMFPIDDGTSNGCMPGELQVTPALGNGDVIVQALAGESARGGTPTSATLRVAGDFFMDDLIDGSYVERYVLLVTDGSPNCGPGGDGDDSFHEPSQAVTGEEIDTLRASGIRTFVVGYDIRRGSNLGGVLEDWAQRGDTAPYRIVDGEDSLVQELSEIAGEVVPCTFGLSDAPEDASYVRVQIDGQDVSLGDDGWLLRDGGVIEVVGTSCDLLRDGDTHGFAAQVECDVVEIR